MIDSRVVLVRSVVGPARDHHGAREAEVGTEDVYDNGATDIRYHKHGREEGFIQGVHDNFDQSHDQQLCGCNLDSMIMQSRLWEGEEGERVRGRGGIFKYEYR